MTTARHFSRNELTQVANQVVGEKLLGRPDQGVREVSTVQNYVLGGKKEIGLKVYRYGLVGAGIGTLGLLYQSPIPAPLQINLVPLAAYPIGTRVITLTLGNANVLANEYAGGWLYVNAGTGIGDCLRIISHPAALALATCVFTCLDATTVAMVVANTVCSLVANPLSGIIVHPSPPTAGLVGVPEVTIAIANFGWFQTKGPAAVLTQGVVAIHQPVIASLTTNGAIAAASHAHTALNMLAADGTVAIAAGDLTQVLRDGASGAIVTAAVRIGAAATPAVTAVIPTSTDQIPKEVGRVMRVGATAEMSLIDLALE